MDLDIGLSDIWGRMQEFHCLEVINGNIVAGLFAINPP